MYSHHCVRKASVWQTRLVLAYSIVCVVTLCSLRVYCLSPYKIRLYPLRFRFWLKVATGNEIHVLRKWCSVRRRLKLVYNSHGMFHLTQVLNSHFFSSKRLWNVFLSLLHNFPKIPIREFLVAAIPSPQRQAYLKYKNMRPTPIPSCGRH